MDTVSRREVATASLRVRRLVTMRASFMARLLGMVEGRVSPRWAGGAETWVTAVGRWPLRWRGWGAGRGSVGRREMRHQRLAPFPGPGDRQRHRGPATIGLRLLVGVPG